MPTRDEELLHLESLGAEVQELVEFARWARPLIESNRHDNDTLWRENATLRSEMADLRNETTKTSRQEKERAGVQALRDKLLFDGQRYRQDADGEVARGEAIRQMLIERGLGQ